ncbi:MAG TPA: hypothetical protein DEB10_02845 [Ruminococcaceae bacterium]|jgi:DNA-binding CsgD family transcriptional regulator|nr:hypothetical protein [Oscillospiraceae bacterium]
MSWIDKIRMKKSRLGQPNLYENNGAYQQRLSLLTTLEYKIFMFLREGFSTEECSQRLNMKRSDVKAHVNSIYSKLNVISSAELIVKYREDS